MGRMTAGQMLGRVDALLPNQYGREEKMQWLAQAEGVVLRETEQVTGALPQVTEEYALTAAAMASSKRAFRSGSEAMVSGVTTSTPSLNFT